MGENPAPSSIMSYRQARGLEKLIVSDITSVILIVLIHQQEKAKLCRRFYCSLGRIRGLDGTLLLLQNSNNKYKLYLVQVTG